MDINVVSEAEKRGQSGSLGIVTVLWDQQGSELVNDLQDWKQSEVFIGSKKEKKTEHPFVSL